MDGLNLPNFNLNLDSLLPALEARIAKGLALVAQLSQEMLPSFDSIEKPLSDFNSDLAEFWAPVTHLNNVADSDDLRAIYEKGAVLLSDFYTTLGQNKALYGAYQKIKASETFSQLTPVQQKIIIDALRDFELAGVGLPPQEAQKFKEFEKALVLATTQFEQHLMDAIKAWHYDTQDPKVLEGIPDVVITQAAAKAAAQHDKGYRLGIDAPTYLAVMGYASDQSLREHFYRAYVTRASDLDQPAFDNSDVMVNIVNLRSKEAKLLNYPHYADYALVKRMVKQPDEVLHFLYDLAQRSRPKAKEDWEALQYFAQQQGHREPLKVWDIPYFSERLKEEVLGFNEEALRPYFPLGQVFKGLLHLLEALFGIHFEEKKITAWHPQVQFLEVYDGTGLIGGIYVDLYARDHKRSGAWMDECRGLRMKDGKIQKPLAFLNANFLNPAPGREAQLTHDEVLTLFHEMGHVLQHLLTKVMYPEVGGIHGISWDAVELPSQFMENFCYEAEILSRISRHEKTGEPLPSLLIEGLRKSRIFQSGLMMLRQIEFALFDMKLYLHQDIKTAKEIQKILDEVRKEVALIQPPDFNRFQHGFSHIFAGGYAAGYYSYKWAEVLSSDAFSRFEAEGILSKTVGMDFRNTILAEGGSREALDVFVDFRGRAPKIDALLRHSGIS